MISPLRIGTRGSPLALAQANLVADHLRQTGPARAVELVKIETEGDQVRDVPLTKLGGDGVFTKSIQQALVEERVDIAVHSLKDLPTFAAPGLMLAAVPLRAPTSDVLISRRHRAFDSLPRGAVLATGSLRRQAQVLNRRPDLRVVQIRGNVETRLRSLVEDNLDALVLAQAGLERLGLAGEVSEVLDPSWFLPAVGQGALGLECRSDDVFTHRLLAAIDDRTTHQCVLAERSMLRGLGGGCAVPIGAATVVSNSNLTLRGVVLSPDGQRRIDGRITGSIDAADALGQQLATELLALGARELLQAH